VPCECLPKPPIDKRGLAIVSYFYHATYENLLDAIQEHGLVPLQDLQEAHWPEHRERSVGKVFLASSLAQARAYGMALIEQNLHEFGESGAPLLLRIARKVVPDARTSRKGFKEYFVERTIPADFIQTWNPDFRHWTWIDVARPTGDGIKLRGDRTHKEDAARYVANRWPNSKASVD